MNFRVRTGSTADDADGLLARYDEATQWLVDHDLVRCYERAGFTTVGRLTAPIGSWEGIALARGF